MLSDTGTAFLREEKESIIKKNLPLIAAFVIPVLILTVIFIVNQVYPFGEEMYMRSDCYHQYLPFMRAFQRALQEGRSLSYVWEIGLGTNFASTYAYYLASPLNWVIALFPASQVTTMMDVFIVLKCGLMSSTFTYYLIKRFGKRTFLASVFGIFYGMSSYMAAYSWNLMWLDCLVLLPLIMLGLERLVKEKKVALYTVTLAIAVLSNYYIGIIICFFLVIYYIYLVIFDGKAEGVKRRTCGDIFGSLFRFFWYSVLAGCMSMIVVLPAIYALFGTASGNFSFPDNFRMYNNMLEVLSKGTILTEAAVFKGYFPNIFCTVSAFILIPYFWINRNIKIMKKAGLTLLLIIFLLCFDANIPTYIWHGFHYPNSLPCRQSFIYIALVLVMCYEAILHIKEIRKLELAIITGLGIGANVLFWFLFKDKEFTLLSGAVTAGGMIVYAVIFFLAKKEKINYRLFILLLFAACIAESAANTAYTGYSTSNRTNYISDNKAITDLLDSINDEGFYRVEKNKRRTKNDGTWLDYKSASVFSSTALDGVTQFYDKFGMQSSMNAFSYYGHTPFVSMLLGVKYELFKEETDDCLKNICVKAGYEEDKNMYLYKNIYSLGLGFAVNTDSDKEMKLVSTNPFKSQNEFAEKSCGVRGLFSVQKKSEGVVAGGEFEKEGRGFLYITNKISEAKVVIKRGETVIKEKTFEDLENPQIIDLGDVGAKDSFTVECTDEDDEGTSLSVVSAVMDYDKLETAYMALSVDTLKITALDEGCVAGVIDIKDGKELLTTIPCDDGWEVKIDGKKADWEKYLGAFIAVKAEPGTHYIEMNFKTPGRLPGTVIAGAGLVLFLLSLVPNKINRKKAEKKRKNKEKSLKNGDI